MAPDPFGTPELFDLAPAAPRQVATGEAVTSAAAPKAVTSATCPECGGVRDVGLLRSGQHLVWREHTCRTWSGAALPCRASGVAVCVAPAKGQRSPATEKRPAPVCQHG